MENRKGTPGSSAGNAATCPLQLGKTRRELRVQRTGGEQQVYARHEETLLTNASETAKYPPPP
eukprot:CAMPEP_0174383218 /NCGR_PEP_ID=MMETSP0811_2-20130205/125064_1 /TAXON_ID=73025 ORGANISM="Eutreptiella gymnastica-like, Strain CCMP1594" /NCGR_SAMPLE_ID=MMETSP0811_2 /ASSEMBLY_ACC=CAM_ASM_000667 /LENGTH=62 /DNA_ID=CAMNT_0015536717 /DNA_START=1317 /DNA_END=1501 /DNA_ORIENTATION=-